MELAAKILTVGLSIGCIYGLIGLTYVAIFNATKIINFSAGDLVMLGAFSGYVFFSILRLPLPLTLIFIVATLALCCWLLKEVIVMPLIARKASIIVMILGTLSIGMGLSGGIGAATEYKTWRMTTILGIDAWQIGGIPIWPQYVIIMGVTVLLVLVYWFVLNKTVFGMAVRATGFRAETASLIGIRISSVVTIAFIISGFIAGVCGFLIGPITNANASMGLPLGIKGFIAAVIGGFGNPYAALLGGLLVGLIEATVVGTLGSGGVELASFTALLVVLAIRPQGLIGGKIYA